MKLAYSTDARNDLEAILTYISERNPQAAADLAERIFRAEEQKWLGLFAQSELVL